MKTLLIAAGMAASMPFAAPALAAPAPAGTTLSAPQDMGGGMRDGRRDDRAKADRRGNGNRSEWSNNGRGDRNGNWSNNRGKRWARGNGWGRGGRWCHNVRRHHRWVRVCGRR